MIVVAGGGIAGIVAAILLAENKVEVCLVEREAEIGGLYKSTTCELGVSFDCGSHFLRSTGVQRLDEILFDGIQEPEWRVLENLEAGSFYGGVLDAESPFLDMRQLDDDIYEKGMVELLNCTSPYAEPENLEQELRANFGDTLTERLFQPIVCGKYYGCALDELAPGSHGLLGLGRLRGLTPEASRELKKLEIYDRKLAFHSSKEGASDLRNFYPAHGGISRWIDLLKDRLEKLNVKVVTGASIDEIVFTNNRVNAVTLSNGKTLQTTHLLWTVPIPFFVKACRGTKRSASPAPHERLYTSLFHFAFDRPPLTTAYLIQCHDPSFLTFRITLYSNVQRNEKDVFHLTAEVISPSMRDVGKDLELVKSEMVRIGVVDPDARFLYQRGENLANGFPLPTTRLTRNTRDLVTTEANRFSNVTFLGRAAGENFTAGGVLIDVFNLTDQLATAA